MKAKILAIVVCTLVIATEIPSVGSLHPSVTVSKAGPNINQPCSRSDWLQLQKLHASDGAANDNFGTSVSLSGDTALIGASECNSSKGAVYVFTRSWFCWTQQAKLTASDGTANDYFGYTISVSGDTALIGAFGCNSNTGAAYVFIRSGSSWTQQAKLTASDGTAYDYFGCSVFVSGDTALIGAPGCDSYTGVVYVFTRSGSNWTQQVKLTALDGAVNDTFGFSVFMSGDTALISAYGCNSSTGAAYVFIRSGSSWTQQAKLTASDGTAYDYFGCSVFVSGDTALIGAYGCNSYTGAAYVFIRSGSSWTQQAKLTASDGTANDWFGYAVSVSGDTAIIGEPNHTVNGHSDAGAAYVFTWFGSSWTQQAELTASDSAKYDIFGVSVFLSGDTALIGASDCNSGKGAVYVFIYEQPPTPPTISGSTTGKANQSYDYTFNATDPNEDNVSYYIDWGDNTSSGWLGTYPSGVAVTQSHTWTTKGTYLIKAKAKDISGNESGWGTLSVTMPLSYEPPHFHILDWLLERFPNAFPILRFLLNR